MQLEKRRNLLELAANDLTIARTKTQKLLLRRIERCDAGNDAPASEYLQLRRFGWRFRQSTFRA